MTTTFWRFAVGPMATASLAGSLWLLDRLGFTIPAPGALMLLTVVYSTWVGGLIPGYVSGVICVMGALPVLFTSSRFIVFPADRAMVMEIITAFAVALPLATAGFRMRADRLLDRERRTRERVEAASKELHILQTALDHVDYGVILLDENLRARFINRASRELWSIPADLADGRPHFRDLMRNACDTGAFARPAASLDPYIEQRVALVRAGDETPIDLHLASGSTVRFRCEALPAGGRFLSYTDVTDLVRHAEALERLATTDELTGIWNRRHFLALAEAPWMRFVHARTPLAVLVLDLDLFKSINDRFGHDVGDAVIEHVARLCGGCKRETDILARFGGEEFVLLMPGTRGGDALAFAEELRRRVEAEPLGVDGELLRITTSIGVAEADPAMHSLGDLLKRADQALYDAKRDGRNRVRTRLPAAPARAVAPPATPIALAS
jgi:diguanylate cyclase (GGDEF)-like protein